MMRRGLLREQVVDLKLAERLVLAVVVLRAYSSLRLENAPVVDVNCLHELISVEVHVRVHRLEIICDLGCAELLGGQILRDEVLQLLSVRIQVCEKLARPRVVVVVMHLTCSHLKLLADVSPEPAALLHVELLQVILNLLQRDGTGVSVALLEVFCDHGVKQILPCLSH